MNLKGMVAGLVIAAVCSTSPCLAQSTANLSANPLTPLCAPYALYPDSLLAQVLAASTYPGQLMEASVWCAANPGLQPTDLDKALASQSWDPTVKALCSFPDVLKKMTGDLDATTTLGQDFLADKGSVMDCVQALRAQAQTLGALKDSPQQTVVTDGSNIVISSPTPNTIYVPTYDPSALYDSSYPYGAGLLTFGAGVALGSAYTDNYGAFNWGGHGMYMGPAYHAGYTGAYTGASAWNHGYGGAGAVHTGSTGIYRGPMGNTTAYHTGTTAAGYRGYGGSGGAYRSRSAFATTAGGGYASHYASRGFGSMGGGAAHFGGFSGGFRGGRR